MTILLYALASLLYLFAVASVWRGSAGALGLAGRQPLNQSDQSDSMSSQALIRGAPRFGLSHSLLLAAIVTHVLSLALPWIGAQGFRFGFSHAASIMLVLGAIILLFESLAVTIDLLWVLVLPVAALAALLPMLFGGSVLAHQANQSLFLTHLIVGMLAYSLLGLAALHAVLMMMSERTLHQRTPVSRSAGWRWLDRVPPLLVLEKFLFRIVVLGFIFLTLTVLTGSVFSEEIFGKPWRLDHKTVFTVLSWGMFGVLLIGRRIWGWRGRLAARLTLGGFALVFLAYIGSRFVLEVLLNRAV
jgi:ABC-type uncharacterized transport system permease subunit